MRTAPLNQAVEAVRRTLLTQEAAGLTDGQLLERFTAHRDEAAFEAIVRRHGPMVWGVCRRILGNSTDAEDAFQSAFMVLVRRAASLAAPDLVAGWLHGVACRTALKARMTRARRRQREQPLDITSEPAVSDAGRDWEPILDRELSLLPERYRVPVILCELEGRSRKETASQLRIPEGTLSSRLAQARKLLARRLSRRGLVLSTLALTPLFVGAAPVPTELVRTVVEAGLREAVCRGILSAFLQGVRATMTMTRVKMALLLLIVGSFGISSLVPTADIANRAEAAQKDKKERGPMVQGVVKSVDAGKNMISVAVRKDPAKKEVEEKSFAVAGDARVIFEDNLTKTDKPPMGTLAGLSEGTQVTLELSADKKTVVAISARGPGIHGHIKSANAEKKTVIVSTKEAGGLVEKTLTLAKGARIIKDDGLGKKKGDAPKEGTFTDLTEGVSVHVQLSVDRKTALGISIQGGNLHGTLKSYDVGTRTLTVTVKEDAQVVDRTLSLAKDARVEGDLVADVRVAVTLSVHDKTVAAAVRVLKD